MTIKIIKDYVDKHTKVIKKAGMVLRDVPDERAKELIEAGVAKEKKE